MAQDPTSSGGPQTAPRPLRCLVVARWYPAVDDPVRGSFLADQVDALAATGAVEQCVASFEFVRLNRVPERQPPEREAILRWYPTALGTRTDAAVPGGWLRASGGWPAAGSVPVARLPVAAGPDDPAWREGDDHAASLLPFASGPAAWSGAIDLVHAHTGFPDGVAAAAASSRIGCPYVITEHASQVRDVLADPELRRRYAAALSGAARVIAVSETLASTLREGLPELADQLRGRMVVIPNSVPLERFRIPDPAERRRGELLYVGSRKVDKGIGTLLEAFARLRADRPRTRLRLVGASPTPEDEARWEGTVAQLGIADGVDFEPATDRAGVAAAMARADVFVHASRFETFGVVAVEALATGLPVVATASGGVSEILGPRPEENGALVPLDDPAALAAAIAGVLDRRATFDPVRLRADVEARFATPVVVERLLSLYDQVLAQARPTRGGANGRPSGAVPATNRSAAGAAGVADAAGPADAAHVAAPAPSAHPVPGSAPAAPAATLPLLIVGMNRVRARRLLSPLPDDLRGRLILVTVLDPGEQPLPAGIGEILELDLDEDYRAALEEARPAEAPRGLLGRAARFARDPGASDRIAGIHERRPEYRLETARRRVAEETRRRRGDGVVASGAAPPDVLCLDGYDVLAAEAALGEGLARLAPGGIRWLADRWAARAQPMAERASR